MMATFGPIATFQVRRWIDVHVCVVVCDSNNELYLVRVNAALVQIKLEFRSVGVCEGSKTGEPGIKPSEQGETQQQTQPT